VFEDAAQDVLGVTEYRTRKIVLLDRRDGEMDGRLGSVPVQRSLEVVDLEHGNVHRVAHPHGVCESHHRRVVQVCLKEYG
jgi:hypothetical protein